MIRVELIYRRKIMVRIKLISVLAFLLLLSGCNISNKDTFDKVSDSSENQITSSHELSQQAREIPDSSFYEEPISDLEIINPDGNTIEYKIKLYNYIGVIIDEVRLVKGNTSEILASNIQPGSSTLAHWVTTEQYPLEPDGFNNSEKPYFILIVSGQEIPITVARLVDNEIHEELHIAFNEIAFFHTENIYYFSPQSDYLDREENPGEHIVQVQYLYLPQVQRWLQQREGQLMFAVGLEEEDILAYFPEYTGDIPLVTSAAVISCETIYIEDVRIDIANDYKTVTEIRESDKLRTFTPDDVIVIAVDHVRFPYLYFRYQDAQGNVHRQYVTDQQRDSNNGTIANHMLTLNDEYYELIPVEFFTDKIAMNVIIRQSNQLKMLP